MRLIRICEDPSPGVEGLTSSEWFAVCAARIFRATRAEGPQGCLCLPRLFAAARLTPALASFLQLQIALSVDPQRSITYEARRERLVGAGEWTLLRALLIWQQHPEREPQDALWFLPVRAIRRVGSQAGRSFALAMSEQGLVIPDRRAEMARAWPAAMTLNHGTRAQRLH